jgi:4,5-DOPA dioxygenase extradiol
MLPTFFISHGAPTLPFEDVPARHFLELLGQGLDVPRGILVVSAHWDTEVPTVNSVAVNDTIHDFYGFPKALYDLTYPAPGSPALADRVSDLLSDQGINVRQDTKRGLDHGAWVPLLLMFPGHNIPVVQLSVQSRLGPGHHLQVGRALAKLREENILILASGSFTHNLSSLMPNNDAHEPEWVKSFADWFDAALLDGRTCDLLSYRQLAPNAARNHPTEEHLLPLFVALGAAGTTIDAEHIHASLDHGTLRMDAYAFS